MSIIRFSCFSQFVCKKATIDNVLIEKLFAIILGTIKNKTIYKYGVFLKYINFNSSEKLINLFKYYQNEDIVSICNRILASDCSSYFITQLLNSKMFNAQKVRDENKKDIQNNLNDYFNNINKYYPSLELFKIFKQKIIYYSDELNDEFSGFSLNFASSSLMSL